MSKAVTLESKIELFRDALYDGWGYGDYRYGVPDVNVMQKLGCTPQSWSRYRPQLIQYCLKNDLIKDEVIDGIEMETIRLEMRYDKKNKQWYGKKEKLMFEPKKGHGWEVMTDEDLKNYKIYWYAEDSFSY